MPRVHHYPYWARFKERADACIEAPDPDQAILMAKELTGFTPYQVDRIPCPADPRLNHFEHEFTDGSKSACPSFCYAPTECANRTACPQRYACSE